MKRQLRAGAVSHIVMLITFLVCPGLYAVEETLPAPEEIIAKNIEARGGTKAFKNIKNRKSIMSLKIIPMNLDAKATVYQERPYKYYSLTSISAMGEERSGSDGKMAWTVSPFSGSRLLEGAELSNTLIQNIFEGPDGPDALYNSMKTEGIEDVNGKACYKVIKTPEKGPERIVYYDKRSFMIVKIITDIISPQGTFKGETFFEEYQKINNIFYPYKTVSFLMGQKYSEGAFEIIEHNIKMQKGIFDIPEEIRMIMTKKSSENI